jgi:RND family efflux transporter MFP subunit
VAGTIGAGLLPRLRRERGLDEALLTAGKQLPVVNVTPVRLAAASAPLELPGDLQAMVESPIFARADGYLSRRLVDIGDRVKKDQLLAEIEMPELDQQILHARATLANSQSSLKELQAQVVLSSANLKLAQSTSRRWEQLEKKGAVSHQEAEEKLANFEVRQAEFEAAQAKVVSARDLIAANEANLRQLQEMKQFSSVTAPFNGIITARNVDVGTLINAGNGGPAKELFRVAQIDTMRIVVNVPQTYVGSVHTGERAEVRVQEMPGKVFAAVVTRFSHAVDPNSRAMLAILELPNPRETLLPGMYSQVRFATTRSAPALVMPGDALILGAKGTRVAVADAQNRVRFRDVQVGKDFGGEIEVLDGVSAGELVIMNPTDAVREGIEVEVRRVKESRR